MAIHRGEGPDGLTVTFVLTTDDDPGPVSVVGSFNDWTPGADLLEDRPDGSRSATITVPARTDVHFRYLGPDGHWFDDPDADEINSEGSVLRGRSIPTAELDDAHAAAERPTTSTTPSGGDVPGEALPEDDTEASHKTESTLVDADEARDRLARVADRIADAHGSADVLNEQGLIEGRAMSPTGAENDDEAG